MASSDATNIAASIVRDGDHYVINGRKWWTSGAVDPRCKVLIFMGKTDPAQPERAPAAVDDPRADGHARGARACGTLPVFGYRRRAARPRRGRSSRTCACRSSNLLLGEGRGFEIAQGRLGPGPHPPLHAPASARPSARSRRCAAARCSARRVRQAAGGAGRLARAHRRRAHEDRPGAAADAERRVDDGRRRQQGGAEGDRDDQGRRAEHRLPGDRPGDPGSSAARASPTTSASAGPTRWRARCASPTARTKCIATTSRKLELAERRPHSTMSTRAMLKTN